MKINSDLGESFGHWKMANDAKVMALVQQANIACGFHAGDPDVMAQTLSSAIENGVQIGAHPSYPDLQGFGRRSIKLSAEEIKHCILFQVSALDGMAQSLGGTVEYIKPHGALYNDMMKDESVYSAVLDAVSVFHKPVELMIQSMPDNSRYAALANQRNVKLIYEVFADRRYTDSGLLTPRSHANAVLTAKEVAIQINTLLEEGCLISESGLRLTLNVDSICVHGDDNDALQKAQIVADLVRSKCLKGGS